VIAGASTNPWIRRIIFGTSARAGVGREAAMKRMLSVFAVVTAVVGLQAGAALARGGGWEPLTAGPFDLSACGANIHVEFPQQKEYVKYIALPDDVTEVKVTGVFKVALTNVDTGVTIYENASGPGRSLSFLDGTFEFVAQGLNIFFGGIAGMPDIFITRGSVDVTYFPDGTNQVNNMNPNIIDVCALLT
jgi:hypothetical protein